MPDSRLQTPDWLRQTESILEELNEGVAIVDGQLRVVFANEALLRLGMYSREEIRGRTPDTIFPAKDIPYLLRQHESGHLYGRSRSEFYLPRKNGERIPAIFSARNIQGPDGQEFVLLIVTDISAQKRVEEQLSKSNALLKERQMEIEEDLRLAARVQNSLTPKSLKWDTISVDTFYHPVHSIGGDFALVNSIDHERLSLMVCDVSGHGIGSALVANRIYSETSAHLRSGMPFVKMFGELNRFLIEDIAGSGMFVTVAAARIDAHRRSLIFDGAGHPPAMLARRGQNPVLLESRSMILGVLADAVDVTTPLEVQLQPDDRILLYTDGITEVFNSRGEMLGVEGVREIVRRASALPVQEMKQSILDGVAAWRNGPPSDDVSLVLVHIR